jgi:hypothetical protein
LKSFRIRREVLTREYGDFSEGQPGGEDMQDVLFAVGRDFVDLYGPPQDDVKTVAFVTLGENQLPSAITLFQGNALELGELGTVQTIEERDPGDDVGRLFHAVSFGSIWIASQGVRAPAKQRRNIAPPGPEPAAGGQRPNQALECDG